MKYNKPKKFNILKKKVVTYRDIDKKPWTKEFKQASKEAYARFEKEGIYMSAHALSRLPRLNQPGLPEVTEKELIEFIHGKPRFSEGENKLIYFDAGLQLAAIKNESTGDIVSVVRRKKPKEAWKDV